MRPDDVLTRAAEVFGVDVADLVGRSRALRISQARQAAMLALRRLCQMSYAEIGRACGGRDASTAQTSVHAAEQRVFDDAAYAARVLQLLGQAPPPAAPTVELHTLTQPLRDIPGGALWWGLREHELTIPRVRTV